MTDSNTRQDAPRSAEWYLIRSAAQVAFDAPANPFLRCASKADKPTPQPDLRIRGYKLLEEIHRGGQGVVYSGVQESTGRGVAIKVLHGGPLLGREELARFAREVHVLAQLQHPNIVTIHESGEVGGRPYLVMDRIHGLALDVFVATAGLPLKACLRLFVRVCRAVHAAHLRGIIHRDLKPGNIVIDERGEPQILDFGLAKLSAEPGMNSDNHLQLTITGHFIGSLPWASPEQVSGSPGDVDLRTDVYSLGIILYQILTGSMPYRVSSDARRAISCITDAKPKRPRSICRQIGRDLETIVLKCLEKQPDRRYPSTASLAEDVERYLAGQPILARPPSTTYQLGKLVARHKISTGLMATLILAIACFGIWMSVLYHRAEQLRLAEHRQRERAEQSLARAEQAEQAAKASAGTARRTVEFLVDLFNVSDPSEARGATITARELLKAGAQRVQRELQDEPQVRAALMQTIGSVEMHLGLFDEAEPLLRQALELREADPSRDPSAVAASLDILGDLARRTGRFKEADRLISRALDIRQRTLGDDNIDVLRTMDGLALLYQEAGRFDDAAVLYRTVLASKQRLLGDDDPSTLTSLNNHALLLQRMGDLEQAETAFRGVLKRERAVLGEDHPDTLACQLNLALLLQQRGKLDEAEALQRDLLAMQRRVLGDRHPDTLTGMNNLVLMLIDEDDFAGAEKLARQVLDIRTDVLGTNHPDTITALSNLALVLQLMGRSDEAEPLCRRALAAYETTIGPHHLKTITAMNNLAALLKAQNKIEEAVALYRQVLEESSKTLGEDHPATLTPLNNLAAILKAQGRFDEAEPLYHRCIEASQRALGPDHPDTLTAQNNLASMLKAAGRLDEARELYSATLGAQLRVLGPDSRSTIITMNNLASTLESMDDHAGAADWFTRAYDGALQSHLAPTALRYAIESNYGSCLIQLGEYERAEPLLLEAYRGLTKGKEPHPRSQKTLERVIDLYEKWNRPDDVAKWRTLLATAD